MNEIVYITAKTPLGAAEAFLPTEMLALKDLDADLLIVPRDIAFRLTHRKARMLLEVTLRIPWFSLQIAKQLIKFIYKSPLSLIKIVTDIAFRVRNPKISLKNLAILPKAIFVADVLSKRSICHIHAHWGTTTSTMAYVISRLTDIPWSLTLQRGDIKENNLLKLKVNSASFTRCISLHGKQMLLAIIGREYMPNITVIPMGVEWKESLKTLTERNEPFTIVTPARFIAVKGHKYLIEALYELKKRGIDRFKCIFYGDGSLKDTLKNDIRKKDLTNWIDMPGKIPNEKLLELYKDGKVDALVLPSINAKEGEHEGIPVSLMEAMAHGIPVISTNTGGIPELIGDGSGIMVKEKDAKAIASAIEKLINDTKYYDVISRQGRDKIGEDFNISTVSRTLFRLFTANRHQ